MFDTPIKVPVLSSSTHSTPNLSNINPHNSRRFIDHFNSHMPYDFETTLCAPTTTTQQDHVDTAYAMITSQIIRSAITTLGSRPPQSPKQDPSSQRRPNPNPLSDPESIINANTIQSVGSFDPGTSDTIEPSDLPSSSSSSTSTSFPYSILPTPFPFPPSKSRRLSEIRGPQPTKCESSDAASHEYPIQQTLDSHSLPSISLTHLLQHSSISPISNQLFTTSLSPPSFSSTIPSSHFSPIIPSSPSSQIRRMSEVGGLPISGGNHVDYASDGIASHEFPFQYTRCPPLLPNITSSTPYPINLSLLPVANPTLIESTPSTPNLQQHHSIPLYSTQTPIQTHPHISLSHLTDRFVKNIFNDSSTSKVTIKTRSSSIDILDEARLHYRILFKSSIQTPLFPPAPNPQTTTTQTPQLIFNPQLISSSILLYPSNKSSGPDKITARLLKPLSFLSATNPELSSRLPYILSIFFNYCFNQSTYPSQWLVFTTTLIPKKTHGECYLDDLRPIGVCNLLRLIFERISLSHLSPLINLSPSQHGFQKHKSTISNLSWLIDTDHPNTTSLFTDFEKAFDKAEPSIILQKLYNRLFLPHLTPTPLSILLYNSILHLYSKSFTYIKINNKLSRLIPRTRCVPQGAISSPLLFNILIDDLPTAISLCVPQTLGASPSSLFADDFSLRTLSSSHLKSGFDSLVTWSKLNHLTLKPSKCGTINYHGPPLIYNNSIIPSVTTYKYVGIPVKHNSINFNGFIHSKLIISLRKLTLLIQSPQTLNWSPLQKLYVFKTYIRPIWEYALPIAFSVLTSLQQQSIVSRGLNIINTAARWILSSFAFPSFLSQNFNFFRYILSLPSFQDRVEQLLFTMSINPPILPPSLKQHFPQLLQHNKLKSLFLQQQRHNPTVTPRQFILNHFFNRRHYSIRDLKIPPILFNTSRTIIKVLHTNSLPISSLQLLLNWQITPNIHSAHLGIIPLLQQHRYVEAVNLLNLRPP